MRSQQGVSSQQQSRPAPSSSARTPSWGLSGRRRQPIYRRRMAWAPRTTSVKTARRCAS